MTVEKVREREWKNSSNYYLLVVLPPSTSSNEIVFNANYCNLNPTASLLLLLYRFAVVAVVVVHFDALCNDKEGEE